MKKTKNQYIPSKILYEDTIGDFYFDDVKSENKRNFARNLTCISVVFIALSAVKFFIS